MKSTYLGSRLVENLLFAICLKKLYILRTMFTDEQPKN